jgi:hypothetical protein
VLIQGPRKTGKTTLEIELACSLSLASAWSAQRQQWTQAPFLGASQCQMGGNVAVINAEMDADDWKDEFRNRTPGSYDASRIFPLHCRGTPLPVITSEAARDWLVGWLAERSVEVLFIDTWGALCAKNGVRNLNDDAEVRVVLDGLDEIKQRSGAASVFVLIHTPHQVPGAKHLERFKGAGSVGDWADALWNYVADDQGVRYLSAVGRARIDAGEQSLAYDWGTGSLSWGGTGSRAQTAEARMAADIIAALEQAGTAGMLTEELLDAVGGHRNTARAMAKKMADRQEIAVASNGARGKRYFAVQNNQP